MPRHAGRSQVQLFAQKGHMMGQFTQGRQQVIGQAARLGPESKAFQVAGIGRLGILGQTPFGTDKVPKRLDVLT
jgi:hypothetical protein